MKEDHLARRVRIGQIKASLILALVIFSITAAPGVARADPCTLQQAAALTIQRTPDGMILVPVTVDGHATQLILDTGSAITSSLFDSTIEAFNLHTTNMRDVFITAEGREIKRFTVVQSLEIGSVNVKSTQFLAWPGNGIAGVAAAGLMGPDVMRQFDLEIDPADSKVRLFSQQHCPGDVIYWTHDYADLPVKIPRSGHVIVSMTLDGKSIDALIDTGSSQTYLSSLAAYRLFDLDIHSPDMIPVDESGAASSSGKPRRYRHQFATLTMAGVRVDNPKIMILEDRTLKPLDKGDFATPHLRGDEDRKLPDLILGMNIIGKLRLYIAYGENHIYFSAANAK